jgi:hypothetical protein
MEGERVENVDHTSDFVRKVSNPIELSLVWFYLTRVEAHDSIKVILYMSLADEALKTIADA